MDALLFHPKVVHLPMALAVLMPLISGGLFVAIWRGWLQPRSWVIAVALQAILVGSSFVALETGEDEEDRVESIVDERHIHEHEEAAEAFAWTGVGALALVLLAAGMAMRGAGAVATGSGLLAVLAAVVVLVLGLRVGSAGGSLVYEHNAGAAYGPESGAATPDAGREEHDDD